MRELCQSYIVSLGKLKLWLTQISTMLFAQPKPELSCHANKNICKAKSKIKLLGMSVWKAITYLRKEVIRKHKNING